MESRYVRFGFCRVVLRIRLVDADKELHMVSSTLLRVLVSVAIIKMIRGLFFRCTCFCCFKLGVTYFSIHLPISLRDSAHSAIGFHFFSVDEESLFSASCLSLFSEPVPITRSGCS